MNQISIESSIAESTLEAVEEFSAKQIDDAIAELSTSQLALVGGGSISVVLG